MDKILANLESSICFDMLEFYMFGYIYIYVCMLNL